MEDTIAGKFWNNVQNLPDLDILSPIAGKFWNDVQNLPDLDILLDWTGVHKLPCLGTYTNTISGMMSRFCQIWTSTKYQLLSLM